jgi:exodeoxyribonuclease VII large subunit
VRFNRAGAQLRDRILRDRMAVAAERVGALAKRAERAERARLGEARRHLDGLARVLDGISYRAVLERGFALVRGEDGTVRRRAGAVKNGESLTLTFADGEVRAFADGEAKVVAGEGDARPPKKKRGTDQGSLF